MWRLVYYIFIIVNATWSDLMVLQINAQGFVALQVPREDLADLREEPERDAERDAERDVEAARERPAVAAITGPQAVALHGPVHGGGEVRIDM